MTVTKRQQLEWLAKEFSVWPGFGGIAIRMSNLVIGDHGGEHLITREEWQQEREKMQKQQDNSWHERGELPPVGVPVELWWGGSFAYNCEFITRRGHHYVMWNLDADRPDAADYMNSEFRPLRTEREKAIEEMSEALIHRGSAMSQVILGELYDAGFRMEKPQ